jgi:hypothetical protein
MRIRVLFVVPRRLLSQFSKRCARPLRDQINPPTFRRDGTLRSAKLPSTHQTTRVRNEWHPRGRNSRREARGLPNTRTVSHPAAPVVSLFDYNHTLATLVDSSHAEIRWPDWNPESTETLGIFLFSSCHRRREPCPAERLDK